MPENRGVPGSSPGLAIAQAVAAILGASVLAACASSHPGEITIAKPQVAGESWRMTARPYDDHRDLCMTVYSGGGGGCGFRRRLVAAVSDPSNTCGPTVVYGSA